MRKETSDLLAALVAKYPKRVLRGLWTDLRKLDRSEFETLLAGCGTARTKRRQREPIEIDGPDDTPASRIQHLLVKHGGMSVLDVVAELRRQLLAQGIEASRIPALRRRQFADWLDALFRSVPASQVMHAAIEIAGRRRG
jgi:hypothetical protein